VGLEILKALAQGPPVITYGAGALTELLGEGAVLVDPFDTGGVRDALKMLLTDHDVRRELSERARSCVMQELS